MSDTNRFLPYTRWPEELAELYRAKGYWRGEPLTAMLARQCELAPDAEAILCGERRFSYGELDAASSRLAANLARHGLGVGDTALVQLPNVAEFYLVFFALLKAGIAPVNALFSHNRLELLSYAEQITPRLFIGSLTHPLFASKGRESERLTSIGAELVLLDGDGGELGLTHWLAKGDESEPVKCGPTPADEVAFFQLSGGSTGTPKLIPRTHDDYYYSVRRSNEICGLGPHTRYLCALPAPHNFPLSSPGALGVFEVGGTVVLAPDPSPISCFPLIARHRVNLTSLVPPAVSLWLQAAEADPTARTQLESLDLLQVGGAKLGEAVASKIGPQLGCRLQQVFGMAEGLVNYTRLSDPDEKVIHTQGRPMSPDDEVRILDEAGNPVAPASLAPCTPAAPIPSAATTRARPTTPGCSMPRASTAPAIWWYRMPMATSPWWGGRRIRSTGAARRSRRKRWKTSCCTTLPSPMRPWSPCLTAPWGRRAAPSLSARIPP